MKARFAIPVAVVVSVLGPAVARAAYTGTVDPSTSTVTLTGSGPVILSSSGGLLHHNDLGPAFAGPEDFASSQTGTQTVPDTGGWTVNIAGAGADSLAIDEGEATNPVSYASGHTFTPGGTPCVVRDPNDRQGQVIFSMHRPQETWFCYPSGFSSVSVHAGTGSVQYGVLDTQPGVPLHLFGGPGKSDQLSETVNVPTSVGGFHQPMSPVYFTAGSGRSTISYIDGPVSAPATYKIGNGQLTRTGMPPLYFTPHHTLIALYPSIGPATIDIGPTGGNPTQIFGNFFGQLGPDTINGSRADAALFITGSMGNDTIISGPVGGGFIFGGGGNPTIYARNDAYEQIVCAPLGSPSTGTVFGNTLQQILNCATVHRSKPVLVLGDVSFASGSVGRGKGLGLNVPLYASGELQLSFERASCAHAGRCSRYKPLGSRSVTVHVGSSVVRFSSKYSVHGHLVTLPPGSYRVSVRLKSHGLRSAASNLTLTIH
jgi:hypothetical protein